MRFRLLNPGGLLMSYSCSGGISSEHFQQIVADAADRCRPQTRASCAVSPRRRTIRWRCNFSEGEYLKGLLCQVD
jgi:23S rRNA (cytosine1962-C5)-methyltransferase